MSRALSNFAAKSGVSIVVCGPGWGGKYGFREADTPTCTECGYKTKAAAVRAWFDQKFGPAVAKELIALLEQQK